MQTNWDGRACVVTGGGGALGQSVVRRLLESGASVHVPAHGERDAEALESMGHDALTVRRKVDLTDEEAVARFYASTGEFFGSVHIAGGFVYGALADASVADFDRMVALNLRTTWLCSRECARRMTGGGRIVNVAAKPALVPAANLVTYAATKAAVAALTQGLAEELAPRGIWVNAVIPSTMDTPANRAEMPDADFTDWPSTDDVAASIVFLASPDNAVTRGALVPVYGKC